MTWGWLKPVGTYLGKLLAKGAADAAIGKLSGATAPAAAPTRGISRPRKPRSTATAAGKRSR